MQILSLLSLFLVCYTRKEITNSTNKESVVRKPFQQASDYRLKEPQPGQNGTIQMGHIGAKGTLPNYEKVLQLARTELWDSGVLAEDMDIEITSRDGCGDSFEGVAAAAEFFHVRHIQVFLGPYCNSEMLPVATMAAYWNVPILAYMATANALSNKKVYKTLVRSSLRTMTAVAESTVQFIKHNGWKRISIVSNLGISAYEKLQAFEPVLSREGVTVAKRILVEETASADDMINSGAFDELRSSARIVLVMFSSVRDLTKPFRAATAKVGLPENEYVYIFPWIQEGANGASPFVGSNSSILDGVKETYANCILIDDTNGFDDRMLTPFMERLKSVDLYEKDIDLMNIYGYITLFDAFKMYAIAARKVFNETGKFSSVSDGIRIFNAMRRLTIPGMISNAGIGSGTIMLDDLAERVPYFSAFYVDSRRNMVSPVANMTPSLVDNCDGLQTGTGCYKIKVTEVSSSFWPSIDGRLPADVPPCGFKGEKCDYTMFIIGGAVLLTALMVILGAWLLSRHCETRSLNSMPWRIWRDDVRIIDEDTVKSMLSLGSQRTKLSGQTNILTKNHCLIGVNTHATYRMYNQRRMISFNRADLSLLMRMKQAVHDNLNPFLGMCFNEKNEMMMLWKFCSRGTLQDVIYNQKIEFDHKFHGAFIKDITLGMEYLHSCAIGYHGALTSWAALIDRNWMIKLTDYGVSDPLMRWEKQSMIDRESVKEGGEDGAQEQQTSILYIAPEIRLSDKKNQRRRMDQTWLQQTLLARRAADIYALGVVIYEILFRSLPFSEKTDMTEMIEKAKLGERIAKPNIQKDKQINPDLIALLQDCWSDTVDMRPNIRRVRLATEGILKSKGSLVDQMMRMMEEYAGNLEKIVKERTGMLEDATKRADRLLSQLLPKYVANELKNGRAVAPRMYPSATVMFTDIVGFTTLCATYTAIEVVSLLNSVYTEFDAIINRNDGYKVETIGDAYMVVSGIPEENGKRHVSNIADIALEVMKFLMTFRVPHRKSDRLRMRVGFHSGSVAAGVVGLNAPRYCLFGDTVTMAHSLESSGVPEKIQLSEESRNLLRNEFPQFQVELRGDVEMKRLGTVKTYWLVGKDKFSFTKPAGAEATSP